MNEISVKQSWRLVRISECCDQISDRVDNPSESGYARFVGLVHMRTREVSIREWGSTEEVASAMKLFKAGDILVARRNVYLERAAQADFDGVCSGDAIVLRAKNMPCMSDLLTFILNTDQFWAYANSEADGSMSKRLTVARLMDYEFALPPLEEQKNIAEALWSSESLKRDYQLCVEKSKTLLHSVINNVALDTVDRAHLSEVCSRITSGSRWWAKYYSEQGDVFFRITNMQRGSIRPQWEDVKYVNAPDTTEAKRTLVQKEDILVSVTAELGLVTLVDEYFPTAYVNQHVALVRPDSKKVDSKFLAYYLASPSGFQQFFRFNDYGAKAGMNLQNLGRIEFPNIPISRQQEISEQISEFDSVWIQMQVRLEDIIEFQRCMISKMMVG